MSMIIWDGRTNKVYDEPKRETKCIERLGIIEPCKKFYEYYDIKLPDTTKLYRYMSYYKLETLLKEHYVYLSNASKLTDRHEREIPASHFKGWPDDSAKHYKRLTEVNQGICHAYLSCWSKRKDDYALWKIYDEKRDGCMIETTLGKLKAQLPKDTVFYEVEYVGQDDSGKHLIPMVSYGREGLPTILGCEKFKRHPYIYEDEVRAVLYSLNDYDGFKVEVDVKELITGAMYNPLQGENAQKKVERLLQDYLPELQIESSIIDEQIK